jgi:hypothetical protein
LFVSGITLLVGGVWLLFGRNVERKVVLAACVAAVVLAVNQATGLAFNTILCFSAG